MPTAHMNANSRWTLVVGTGTAARMDGSMRHREARKFCSEYSFWVYKDSEFFIKNKITREGSSEK